MEQPLIRSETVPDISLASTITTPWPSSESFSKYFNIPSSSSGELQPRALKSSNSSQNMIFHDQIPSMCIPGAGTDLSGPASLNDPFSLADSRIDGLDQLNYKYDDKHDAAYHHPSPPNDHYSENHYSYESQSHPHSVFMHRPDTSAQPIYNDDAASDRQWSVNGSNVNSSQPPSRFPYTDSKEENSPFLSGEHSPHEGHQRMHSFPDSNHSGDLYTTMDILSPLHPGVHSDNQHHHTSNSFLHSPLHTTPEQFVNMEDVASLGGVSSEFASEFASDYARSPYDQISPAEPGGTISFLSLNNSNGDYALSDQGSSVGSRKRKRTGNDADDEGMGGNETGSSSSRSSSASSAKKARVGNNRGGGRGRRRKNAVPSQFPTLPGASSSPGENNKPDVIDGDDDSGSGSQDAGDDSDGDDGVYGDDGDDDSDVYVPSRSASPSGNKGRRASSSSYESSKRRGVRATGSAAQALKQMETLKGLVASVDDSTYGGCYAWRDSDVGGRGKNPGKSHPVPVPNLTKKSRGRKVPVDASSMARRVSTGSLDQYGGLATSDSSSGYYQHSGQYGHGQTGSGTSEDGFGTELGLTTPQPGRPARGRYSSRGGYNEATTNYGTGAKVVSGGIKKANGERRYVCTTEGCGKCFVRGEHLKRHVRSLHTWDKPHKCPHPGCNKSFSRRDNLGQHVRVHMA